MRFSRSSSLVLVALSAACATGVDVATEALDPLRNDAGLSADTSHPTGQAGSTGGSGSASSGGGGVPNTDAAGGTAMSSGGAGVGTMTAGSGGTNGGGAPTGDAASTDGAIAVDSANGCVAAQKACGGRCVLPNASVGCSLTGCDACGIGPPHGFAKCTGDQCDFDCLSGYVRSGTTCVVSEGGAGGTGGSDGGGDSGGSNGDAGPGSCDPSQCSGCIPFIQAPCCKSDHTCGCQYPFAKCS